jgi:hypothetical protein
VADNQEIGEREQGGETGEREGATGENQRSRYYDPIIGGMLWPLRRALVQLQFDWFRSESRQLRLNRLSSQHYKSGSASVIEPWPRGSQTKTGVHSCGR